MKKIDWSRFKSSIKSGCIGLSTIIFVVTIIAMIWGIFFIDMIHFAAGRRILFASFGDGELQIILIKGNRDQGLRQPWADQYAVRTWDPAAGAPDDEAEDHVHTSHPFNNLDEKMMNRIFCGNTLEVIWFNNRQNIVDIRGATLFRELDPNGKPTLIFVRLTYLWIILLSAPLTLWHRIPRFYAFVRNKWVVWKDRKQGLCPGCGYDLRASPDRCPECGLVVEKSLILGTGPDVE